MALCRHAPRGAWMTATRRFPFPAAHWMIYRVHHNAPHLRPSAEPSFPPCLAEAQVLGIEVPNLADRGPAFQKNLPHLSGRKPHLGIARFLGHELAVSAGRTDQLTSPANLEFQIVDQGSQRNVIQRNGIPRFDVRLFAADDRIPHGNLGRGDNIPFFAVGIIQQRDPR